MWKTAVLTHIQKKGEDRNECLSQFPHSLSKEKGTTSFVKLKADCVYGHLITQISLTLTDKSLWSRGSHSKLRLVFEHLLMGVVSHVEVTYNLFFVFFEISFS